MDDNFVPPSGLLDRLSEAQTSAFEKNYKNTPLRVGVVTKIHEIDDESNASKLFPEYDVVTSEQNNMVGQGFVEYTNCISIDSLGGLADFFEYKLRQPDKQDFRETYKFDKQDGSLVLLLCLDGSTDRAIIIGGIPNPSRKTNLTKDNGLHMEGEYNGVNWKINKDGELTLTYKSKTDNEGNPQDEEAGGTFVEINKTGQVDINTGLTGSDETYMRMDKKNKDIGLKAGNHIGFTAVGNVGINADGRFFANAGGNAEINAEGSAKFTSKSSLNIEGKSIVEVKSDSVTIDGSNLVEIKTQTCQINGTQILLGQGGTPALILSTKFIGTGNKGSPVVSSAIGPFSSTVFIAT